MELEGKTVIVTGANAGIGYETALGLAKKGARIILACRDEAKACEACRKIIEESKNDQVEVELLDLSKMKSIREFSNRIKSKLDKLDILINNAGIFMSHRTQTEDGFETTFQVNYLGPYYLTRLLLDLIIKSAPSRIINVSSLGHKGVNMNWNDLQFEKNFSGFGAYRQTKLGNCLFTIKLAERLKDFGVIVVSLHPGAVKTEILRVDENTSFGVRLFHYLFVKPSLSIIGITPTEGALTSIYCATASDLVSGAYYDKCKIGNPSSQATNNESANKLWSISAELCHFDE